MTRKIKQVSEWIIIFDHLHQISSILNKKSGYQSLWDKKSDALEELEYEQRIDDYRFLDYCEMIQKNNSVTGIDN
jgi:hypothetical protein